MPWPQRWISVAWALPIAFSLFSGNTDAIKIITSAVAAFSCAVILVEPSAVLIALPFFALLSPMAGFFNLAGGRVLLSDALFLALAVQLPLLMVTGRVRVQISLSAQLAVVVSLLYALSAVNGLLANTLVSMKPVLYLFQLVIIGCYTNAFAKTEKSWHTVINSWIIATFLGALLLLQAFITGRSLSKFGSATLGDIVDQATIQQFFRADYYYTGFHFALGISIAILVFRLLLGGTRSRALLSAMLLPVLAAAVLVMISKTTILSIAITVVGVFVALWSRLSRGTVLQSVVVASLSTVAIYLAVSSVAVNSIAGIEIDMWGAAASGTSSLTARFPVYASASAAWVERPVQVLVGMGPDFLDYSGEPALALNFRRSKVSGVVEGTVDSGWLSYLIELGVLGFGTLVGWIVLSIRTVYQHARKIDREQLADSVAVPVLAGLVYTTIALLTQMLGYTKVSWFPFQLLLIGFLHAQSNSSEWKRRRAGSQGADACRKGFSDQEKY